jgi:hypothetical protein
MTSTEYEPMVVDPTPDQATEPAREQGEPVGFEPTAELVDATELGDATGEAGAADPATVDVSEGVGAPLLVSFVGGLALLVAVLTPVAGARIAALVIVGVAVALVCRLLTRRAGGAR